MPFTWPGFIFNKLNNSGNKASLTGIFITESAGMPMHSVNNIQAIASKGLSGDRYFNKTGYWDPVEGCQVTLISEHDLMLARRDLAKQNNNSSVDNGQHRRNLVVTGIKTKALEGKQFQIGEAIFSYEKPRPPCGYLNTIEGHGMAKALSYNSGICIQVIRSGKLCVGDALKIVSCK